MLSDDRIAEMMRDTWGCASIAPRHSDLSNLTERGAKAWAGVDVQKLREDGTT